MGLEPSQDVFVAMARALDRLYISGNYGIPIGTEYRHLAARSAAIQRPSEVPLDGVELRAWWSSELD